LPPSSKKKKEERRKEKKKTITLELPWFKMPTKTLQPTLHDC